MSRKNMILKMPSTFDLAVNWSRKVVDQRQELVTCAKVKDYYLRIVHRPNGLFDLTTLRSDPSKGHFNEGKVELISNGFKSLIQSKLVFRNIYLTDHSLFNIWTPNDGNSDLNALASRCIYEGNLNIRSDFDKGKYFILFSNLRTNRISIIEKAIKLPNIEAAYEIADAWRLKRRIK